MKVICIDNSSPCHAQTFSRRDLIYELKIYTVVCESFIGNDLYYYLAERQQSEPLVAYNAKCFLPLSDIDERERRYRSCRGE